MTLNIQNFKTCCLLAEEDEEERNIVPEALLGKGLPNYFLRHNILVGSWADVMLNSEQIPCCLSPQLGTELGSWFFFFFPGQS